MARILFVIWQTLFLFLPLHVWGEEQDSSAADSTDRMRDEYITASLLVVSPASEVYSMFGHCALRLNCPAHQMDYCFTFEMSTSSKGILSFFTGQAMGGFVPAPTKDYLDYYRKEQRSITQYTLNLTPAEKQQLWKTVDQEVARGYYRHYDYRRVQCVTMLISLIEKALEQPIVYRDIPQQVQGTLRHQILTEGKDFPWSEFCFQTIKGSETDVTEPIEEKITPRMLPLIWQGSTVGEERLLIAEKGVILVEGKAIEPTFFTPACAFTLLFIVVLLTVFGQVRHNWTILPRLTDMALLFIYTLMALVVTSLVLYSKNTGVYWNWYLPAFNPLPLLLLLIPGWRKGIVWCMLIILLASILSTPFIPQFDLPHALLMACLTVRLYAYILSKKDKHQ